MWVKEKTPFLLCASPHHALLPYSQAFTSSVTPGVWGFHPGKNFLSASWAPHSSALSRCSPETAPDPAAQGLRERSPCRRQAQDSGSHLCVLLTDQLQVGIPRTPPLGSVICSKAHRTPEVYQCVMKGDRWTPRWKRCVGQGTGERNHCPWHLHMFTSPDDRQTLYFEDFCGGFITEA